MTSPALTARPSLNAVAEFRDAIAASGLTPPDQVEADGKLHRFPSNGKRGDDSGWYVLHGDGVPAGAFGDWRSDVSETWRAKLDRKLTANEEKAHRERVRAIREQREADEAQRHADARARAARIWTQAAQAVGDDHPYLRAKGVLAHRVRYLDGRLVVPMRDSAGELHSLQFIDGDGGKKFLTGGRVTGCYFAIGKPGEVLCIAEGFATAASIHEATGHGVAVAFNAGNLLAAAKSVREKHPDARIVICGDHDTGGVGQEKAKAAAEAVGGTVAIPAEVGDWNDVHREHGVEAVRSAIADVLGVHHNAVARDLKTGANAPPDETSDLANQGPGVEDGANAPPLSTAEKRKVGEEIDGGAEPKVERAQPPAATHNPAIDVLAGGLVKMVEAAIGALRAVGSELYDRGGMLVRPVEVTGIDRAQGIVRQAGSIVLRPVSDTWLVHELARVASWRRFDARDGAWRAVHVPERVAATIVDAPDLGAWPTLYAVVRAPLMLPDGRIIGKPGYDADSGLLADWVGEWHIPEAPTRDDAAEALHRLHELLRHYAFEAPVDRAVAVSAMVTAIERPALAAAPLHGFSSPEPGAGKSLLVDAVSLAATGAPAAVMEWGSDRAEAAKRLDAVMLAGDPILAIDNVERPLEGATLCQFLTQPARRIRPLGASVAVTVPCVSMVCATGCNLTIRGDAVRRAVICRIDPGVERPELRVIEQDLLAEVRGRRRAIVADALTIVKAYHLAGSPDFGLAPLGGYEGWSRTVRAALAWAGGDDACATMDKLRADDPHRSDMRAVFRAWRAAVGPSPITCSELIARADSDATLRTALRIVAERKGHLQATALGWWCRAHRDKRIDGLRLAAQGPNSDGVQAWRIEENAGG